MNPITRRKLIYGATAAVAGIGGLPWPTAWQSATV